MLLRRYLLNHNLTKNIYERAVDNDKLVGVSMNSP